MYHETVSDRQPGFPLLLLQKLSAVDTASAIQGQRLKTQSRGHNFLKAVPGKKQEGHSSGGLGP